MALNTPSNLYSGYAQVFNNAPHLAFQARLLQQHAAKRQALDDYYRKLPLTINEKGTRDAERSDISKSMLGIKKYWIDNKERLRNGDDAAAFNYEKMIRDHQDLVNESQKAGLTDMQVGKLLTNPKTSYVADNKDFMDRVHRQSLSVRDAEHEGLDVEELTLPQKPFDRTQYFKEFSSLKGDAKLKKIDNGDGTETIINSPQYGKEAKEYIMEVAADKYMRNEDNFKEMVNNDLGVADASNPLNADFKEHFGHNIQTPIDLATAYTFKGLKPPPVTGKIQTNQLDMLGRRQTFAKQQQQRQFTHAEKMLGLREGYQEMYKKASTKIDAGEFDNNLDELNEISYNSGNSKLNKGKVEHITIDGEKYKGRFIAVPSSMVGEDAEKVTEIKNGKEQPVLNVKGEPQWQAPDRYYMTDDKKNVIAVFFGDDTVTGGKKIKDSKIIPIHLWKQRQAKDIIGKKQQAGEITSDADFTDVEDDTPVKTTTSESHTIKSTKKKTAADYGL